MKDIEKKIKVYENFLPENLYLYLNKIITSEKIFWQYMDYVAYIPEKEDDKRINQFGFAHLIVDDYNVFSPFYDDFIGIIDIMQTKHSIEVFNLQRMRLGMQVKVDSDSVVNDMHTDYSCPHSVLLIYLNDSDGNTIFYNDEKQIIKEVTFKPNSAVLFDGNIFHSSSTPKFHSRRIALNINFNFTDE